MVGFISENENMVKLLLNLRYAARIFAFDDIGDGVGKVESFFLSDDTVFYYVDCNLIVDET